MSDTLADSAAQLCALVCRQFLWRPADFWSATPAELATILADPSAEPEPRMDRQYLNTLVERERDGR